MKQNYVGHTTTSFHPRSSCWILLENVVCIILSNCHHAHSSQSKKTLAIALSGHRGDNFETINWKNQWQFFAACTQPDHTHKNCFTKALMLNPFFCCGCLVFLLGTVEKSEFCICIRGFHDLVCPPEFESAVSKPAFRWLECSLSVSSTLEDLELRLPNGKNYTLIPEVTSCLLAQWTPKIVPL